MTAKSLYYFNEETQILRFPDGQYSISLALEPGDDALPCPFCGCESVGLSNTHTACYSIVCQACGAEVPGESFGDGKGRLAKSQHRKAANSAIAAWNRRQS